MSKPLETLVGSWGYKVTFIIFAIAHNEGVNDERFVVVYHCVERKSSIVKEFGNSGDDIEVGNRHHKVPVRADVD